MLPRIPRQICSLRDKASISSATSSCIEIGGHRGAMVITSFCWWICFLCSPAGKYATKVGLEIASVSKGKIRVFIVAGKLNTPKHTVKKTLENISDRTGLR